MRAKTSPYNYGLVGILVCAVFLLFVSCRSTNLTRGAGPEADLSSFPNDQVADNQLDRLVRFVSFVLLTPPSRSSTGSSLTPARASRDTWVRDADATRQALARAAEGCRYEILGELASLVTGVSAAGYLRGGPVTLQFDELKFRNASLRFRRKDLPEGAIAVDHVIALGDVSVPVRIKNLPAGFDLEEFRREDSPVYPLIERVVTRAQKELMLVGYAGQTGSCLAN